MLFVVSDCDMRRSHSEITSEREVEPEADEGDGEEESGGHDVAEGHAVPGTVLEREESGTWLPAVGKDPVLGVIGMGICGPVICCCEAGPTGPCWDGYGGVSIGATWRTRADEVAADTGPIDWCEGGGVKCRCEGGGPITGGGACGCGGAIRLGLDGLHRPRREGCHSGCGGGGDGPPASFGVRVGVAMSSIRSSS